MFRILRVDFNSLKFKTGNFQLFPYFTEPTLPISEIAIAFLRSKYCLIL